MVNLYRNILASLYISTILLFLVSCGGGGGGGSKHNNDNTDPPPSGNINSGLTGHLYANNKEDGVMVDLSTGNVSRVPKVRWDETADYANGVRFSAIPHQDGKKYLLTAIDCQYHSGEQIGFRYRDCLMIVDSNGNIVSSTVLYEGLSTGAKISDDGNYVAFMYRDKPNDSYPLAELFIADKDLVQITSHTKIKHINNDSGLLWRNFDWVNNGQIVYGYDRSIYITAAYGTEGSLLYTLPNDTNGNDSFLYDPKVSPDGSEIAFRHITNSNFQIKEGNVWVMNIDGTDPHRLVYTPDNKTNDGGTTAAYQVYNDHAWSPDGKYILVAVGGTSGDIGSPGVSDTIYAVPSEGRDIPLNDSGENGVIKIRTYYDSPNTLTSLFEPYSGTITWME
jgi:hypothetical protein